MRWLCRQIAWVLLALSTLSVGFANDNDKKFSDANIDCWVGLTSHEKDAKVSGTNVNWAFRVNWGSVAGYSGGTWDQVSIIHLKVQCDDLNETFIPAPGPQGPTLSKTIRFASTHFNDDSTITFTIKGKLDLVDLDNGMGSKQVEFTHTATLVAYNKGLTLATKEEYWDPPVDNSTDPPTDRPKGYWIESPQFPDGYAQASQDAMPSARSALTTAKHTILNSSNFLSESELAPLLKQATCFFGFTHGETTNFRASQTDQLYFSGNPNEVANYVQSNRTALPFNMVVMHACNTVGASGNGSWQAPAAFQVATIPGVIADKAYAGFTASVWSLTQKNFSLSKHAEIVYQQLVAGKTIKYAVDAANKKVIPKVKSGSPLFMVVKGDPYSKIVNVYLNSGEWTKERDSQWFVVFD